MPLYHSALNVYNQSFCCHTSKVVVCNEENHYATNGGVVLAQIATGDGASHVCNNNIWYSIMRAAIKQSQLSLLFSCYCTNFLLQSYETFWLFFYGTAHVKVYTCVCCTHVCLSILFEALVEARVPQVS